MDSKCVAITANHKNKIKSASDLFFLETKMSAIKIAIKNLTAVARSVFYSFFGQFKINITIVSV
jgi:hypothetical protein